MTLEVMRSTVCVMGLPRGAAVTVVAMLMMRMLPTAVSAAEIKPCKVSNINVQRAVDWPRVRFVSKYEGLSVCRLM